MLKLALLAATLLFWPPWLSIESPTNPFDPSTRDAVFLVHAMTRDGTPKITDLTATAEGLVNGSRQTISLNLSATGQPGVFAVRKQWPASGAWLIKITLVNTTALVSIDASGRVASVNIPQQVQSNGQRVPRAVSAHDIDSTLTALAPSHGR
jgi:hypothetical protein